MGKRTSRRSSLRAAKAAHTAGSAGLATGTPTHTPRTAGLATGAAQHRTSQRLQNLEHFASGLDSDPSPNARNVMLDRLR